MDFRYGIKQLSAIVNQAKPGDNVTQEEYDIMVSVLNMTKKMQKLNVSANVIAMAIAVSCIANLAIKFGYDADLGTKIQHYVIPIDLVAFTGVGLLKARMMHIFENAKGQVDKLHNINISQMFR